MLRLGFFLRISLPVAAGVYLGLWLHSCSAPVVASANDAFDARGTIQGANYTRDDEYSFYTLTLSDNHNGGLLISIDKKLPLATWLQQHNGRRVRFTLDPDSTSHVERIERGQP